MKYGRGLGVCIVVGLGTVASAGTSLDQPFTATPAQLLAAAKAAPAGDAPVVILRDDTDLTIDDQGRSVRHWRFVFVVRAQAGVDDWGVLWAAWHPSYQDKPEIRGRVIAPDGHEARFDATRFTDAPSVEKSAGAVSDERKLKAPLPQLAIGAVVEEEVITRDRVPLLAAGATDSVWLGNDVPTVASHVAISAPASRKLKLLARGFAKGVAPTHEVKLGRERWTLDLGALAPNPPYEREAPADAVQQPMLSIATGASWNAVARDYGRLLERRIAEGPVPLAAQLPRTPTLATARAIVAWLHAHVRATGIELGVAAITPATPAETVQRGAGDDTAQATLLVALLRQAGIRAEVALLSTGPGLDVHPELVGLGAFDHAIVHASVAGAELWIDASEELVPVGALPSRDQGRRALIIADATAALVPTPARPADNRAHELRTFELAELGTARVIEVSRETGAFAPWNRQWYRDARDEERRASFVDYIKNQFDSDQLATYSATSPTDLARPYELTLVATHAHAAYSGRDKITVRLYPGMALTKVPDWLREAPDAGAPPRRLDFEWHRPHVHVVENRLLIPPGFTPPALPPDRVREVGTATLTEHYELAANTLTATFTFDSGPARVAAAKVAALHEAVRELDGAETTLVFENTASALSEHGKPLEAIREIEQLIALHPKEAVHRAQLAQAYLRAGAGAAARREARKAVQLEPANADAHVMLGWMLRHDTLGRPFGFDHDRAGALAEYAKARKLDPSHVGVAVDYATVLQKGADGTDYTAGADIPGAVAAWRAAYALDASDDNARALVRILLWSDLGAEAEQIARARAAGDDRDMWLVAATAVAKDPSAALAVAASLRTGAERDHLVQQAMTFLMGARKYDVARSLQAGAGAMPPQLAQTIQVLQVAPPYKLGRAPADLAKEMFIVRTRPGYASPAIPERLATWLRRESPRVVDAYASARDIGGWFLDDTMTLLKVKTEGRPDGPWKLTVDMLGKTLTMYAALDGGRPTVIGFEHEPTGIGRQALALLAKGDEAGARQLLDWFFGPFAAKRAPGPLNVWDPARVNDTAAAELAAAMLASGSDAARAIPILTRCATPLPDVRALCDGALSATLKATRRWKELDAHAQAWVQRDPSAADAAIAARIRALVNLKRAADAQQVLDDALAKTPTAGNLLRLRAAVGVARGDIDAAITAYDAVIQSPAGTSGDKNNAAWLRAARGRDLPLALEYARAANRADAYEHTFLNTLAVVEVESGELGDARAHGLRSMELGGRARPGGQDWYFVGRLFEELGLRGDAIAAYKAIKRGRTDDLDSSYALGRARLKRLGVTR